MFSELCKEEPHVGGGRSGSNCQVSVILELTCFVFCSVDVEQFPGLGHPFNWEV